MYYTSIELRLYIYKLQRALPLGPVGPTFERMKLVYNILGDSGACCHPQTVE